MTGKDDTEVTEVESTAETPEPTAETTETTDASEESTETTETTEAPRRRRLNIGVLVAAVALIASAGLASWLYFFQYTPDQQTDADAQKIAVDAATQGSVALLTYSPETLDQDFAAAKSRLTGEFLQYYTQFTEEIVTPAAREKSVKTNAAVVQAAVSEMQPDSAEVLLFINQTTTSKENPDGAYAASAVKVGLTKIDGSWLISAFDPV